MLTQLLPVLLDVEQSTRFIAQVKDIVGAGNLRVFYLPAPTEGTTSIDAGVTNRTWTHLNTPSGRITGQGDAWLLTMNGTSDSISCPDAADLTFGNGVLDQAFSIFAVCNVTNTANTRVVVGKQDASATNNPEWVLRVSTTNTLTLVLTQKSLGKIPSRASNGAITVAALTSLGSSYDGSGGATAANGITLYQNGAVIASTATNDALYVAMEDTAATPEIGSQNAHAANFGQGTYGCVVVVAGNLSADQHLRLYNASRAYYLY